MSFIDHFSELEDPRSEINQKHNLLDVIFLTVTAVISGAEGWKDIHDFGRYKLDWLKQYRSFEHGLPVDDTIARIISALNPDVFTRCFIAFVNELRQAAGREMIAIDGKTLRGSFKDGDRQTALHSVTVWSKCNGLVLAQTGSPGKKNENAAVLEILDMVEMQGAIITADAMNTQKKIAQKIFEKKADYVLAVKRNQKLLYTEIEGYFEHMKSSCPERLTEQTLTENDVGHGRIETRVYRQLRINDWISEADKWCGAMSIIEVERTREVKGTVEKNLQYYISSLPIDLPQVSRAIRGHWEVENKAHWVLDVVYKEDASRIRREEAAENIGLVRRFALNLARLHPEKNSMKGKLKMAMWSDNFRHEIIFGNQLNKV